MERGSPKAMADHRDVPKRSHFLSFDALAGLAGNVVNPKSQLITVAGSAASAVTAMHADLVREQTQYAVERQRDDSPVAHNFSPVQG
jgi:hypothetical protein